MIVVDASVLAVALADDGGAGDRARARLRRERLAAPHLIDVEVVSAWRRLHATGAIDDRRAALATRDLLALPLRRVPHGGLLERAWELRADLTTYDAVYVALAEALDATLVTADRRMAAAPGVGCEIDVLG